jgi:hypothetical protein
VGDVTKMIALAERLAAKPSEPSTALEGFTPGTRPEFEHEGFVVETLAHADWILEVLGGSEERKLQNKELAAEARRRVDRWLEEVNGQEDRDTSYLRALLEQFMAKSRELILGKKSEKKSRVLPHGTLGWRSAPQKLVYENEEAALAWAREQGIEAGLYRMVCLIEKDAVKAYATKNKIVPPGARWEGGSEEGAPFAKPNTPVLPTSKPALQLPKSTTQNTKDGVTP